MKMPENELGQIKIFWKGFFDKYHDDRMIRTFPLWFCSGFCIMKFILHKKCNKKGMNYAMLLLTKYKYSDI